ncbi:MAG: BrnA antitoxin family protein [Asticcacaulis sp.]|uniref:BrnA antitoxin family protein n=1 Tax=Asticcacaulis sp. TaxID=1872648 RepID=UPI003F7B5505
MNATSTKSISLDQIRQMQDRDELVHDPNAPEGESLGADFWAKAEIRQPKKPRSVHLKLDPDVFDFFVAETHGKGHLTRMQDVLKAYMTARKAG